MPFGNFHCASSYAEKIIANGVGVDVGKVENRLIPNEWLMLAGN
jgi:hypothetical protein